MSILRDNAVQRGLVAESVGNSARNVADGAFKDAEFIENAARLPNAASTNVANSGIAITTLIAENPFKFPIATSINGGAVAARTLAVAAIAKTVSLQASAEAANLTDLANNAIAAANSAHSAFEAAPK